MIRRKVTDDELYARMYPPHVCDDTCHRCQKCKRCHRVVDREQGWAECVACQRMQDYVQRVVADAPQLTAEQRARLAVLLRPVLERTRRIIDDYLAGH